MPNASRWRRSPSLAKRDKFDRAKLAGVVKELNINPEKPSALYA